MSLASSTESTAPQSSNLGMVSSARSDDFTFPISIPTWCIPVLSMTFRYVTCATVCVEASQEMRIFLPLPSETDIGA